MMSPTTGFEQFEHDFRAHGRRYRRLLGWLTGSLLLVVLIGGWLLARAGLLSLPFLSPTLPNLTKHGHPAATDQADRLKAKLSSTDGSITLSEADLKLLVGLLNPKASIELTDGQIIWQSPAMLNGRTVNLTLALIPHVKAGRLEFDVKSAKIGFVSIPKLALKPLANLIQNQVIATHPLVKQIEWRDIAITDEILQLTATIPASVVDDLFLTPDQTGR